MAKINKSSARHGGIVRKISNAEIINQFPSFSVFRSAEISNLITTFNQFTRPVPVEKINMIIDFEKVESSQKKSISHYKAEADGKSILMYAILKSNDKAVDELLSRPGIDVNVISKEGKTALDYAVEKGNFHAAQKLNEMAARINTPLVTTNEHTSDNIYQAIGLTSKNENQPDMKKPNNPKLAAQIETQKIRIQQAIGSPENKTSYISTGTAAVGALVGAAGLYLANKFRNKKEADKGNQR
jgi:hypothetical protein